MPVETSTKYPLWDPKSADLKRATRPPYLISFTPYTTPTPLPNRPDWKKEDWLEYFRENHPNFWFEKELKKKAQEKLNLTLPEVEESEFDLDNWKSWTPEQWIKWSNSKQYKETQLNVLNQYQEQYPYKVYEDLDGPVLDFKSSQPVFVSETSYQKWVAEQKQKDNQRSKLEQLVHSKLEALEKAPEDKPKEDKLSPLPPRTYFPKPTVSPTQDPFYIRTQNQYLRDEGSIGGISDEYIYVKPGQKRSRQDDTDNAYDFR